MTDWRFVFSEYTDCGLDSHSEDLSEAFESFLGMYWEVPVFIGVLGHSMRRELGLGGPMSE